ncbi:hypothetical protein II898_05300 [bacterium]|nr:hypothetical protein [bacterium]
MRKNLFWILTAILEIVIILILIFRYSSNEYYVLDIYPITLFFIFEAYIFAGFFLKEMIPHRKKMFAVMFVNVVVIFFPIL